MTTAMIHLHPTSDGQLKVEPADQLTDGLRQFIRTNKAALVEAGASVLVFTDPPESVANPEQHPHWLAQLAAILKCDATYLLANGYIDWHDLTEQDGSDPQAIADLIRSNPAWQPQIDWRAVGKQYARATALTAATAEPEWLLARDAYHHHWAACLDCHPPVDRYCATGAALKARYEAITEQEREQTA